MDELKKEIGKRIKQCRKEKGMTQKELAKEVGCHEGTIRQYENGLRSPRLVSQYAIAKALSVPHESLFTLSAPCAQLSTNLAEVGTDCISRQDALEAFGLSEKTRKYGGDHSGYDTMMMYEIQDTIENLPPIQPEIIRCRECKFASGDSRICMKFNHSPIGELDFCAWAERRTDG